MPQVAASDQAVVASAGGMSSQSGAMTRMPVLRISVLHNQGLCAEEIVALYPHLSLAQIHAALAYYFTRPSMPSWKPQLHEGAEARKLLTALQSRDATVFTTVELSRSRETDEGN